MKDSVATIHWDVRFDDRLDCPDNAAHLSKSVLAVPEVMLPLALRDWRDKKIAEVRSRDWAAVSELLLMSHMDKSRGLVLGGVTLESPREPEVAFISAGWVKPRNWGFNGVGGILELASIGGANADIDGILEWISGMCSTPIRVAVATAESGLEHKMKMETRYLTDKGPFGPYINPKRPPEALTDIVWLNVFGRPYVDMIGRERLLSTPAYSVKELPNGAIVVQASESPFEHGSKEYDERCKKIKEHIGLQYFFDWDNPERECPRPRLETEYVAPREMSDKELEEIRVRAGIPPKVDRKDPGTQDVWLVGLREWVEHNETYSEGFRGRVDGPFGSMDYSVESLRILDKYFLKHRKKNDEIDPQIVLEGAAYLAQVLVRNAIPRGGAHIQVDEKLGHATVVIPNGITAVPMARISNLWRIGRSESARAYAEALLSAQRSS